MKWSEVETGDTLLWEPDGFGCQVYLVLSVGDAGKTYIDGKTIDMLVFALVSMETLEKMTYFAYKQDEALCKVAKP